MGDALADLVELLARSVIVRMLGRFLTDHPGAGLVLVGPAVIIYLLLRMRRRPGGPRRALRRKVGK